MRHAKAAGLVGVADHERPLAERGEHEAADVGRWLSEQRLIPDLVLCSTALRTRQTAEFAAAGVPISYERRIYDNDVDELFDLVAETADGVRTLLIVGHSPSVHGFVQQLTGATVDEFPTAAAAVVAVDGPWAELSPGGGSLAAWRQP
ncbi:SixA phosphatase family protein [Rhizohabitans arisaemae]|uniref:SixA phosphatase family protein n=1 Tax=Rhizohabitans arisaemae TaxID=2720610 RepID=UPI0024B2332C|nr:histidine phosphatase family protein [Rhizohabitans arisaemae]